MKVVLLIASLIGSSVCMASQHSVPPEKALIGDWCARDKPAYHEEFTLDISSGEHTFAAFLHQRPAEQGTWNLVGDSLTIKASSITFTYHIESYSKGQLVLVTDRGDREYYFRTRCVAFGT